MLDADARCVVKIVVKCAGVIEKDKLVRNAF